jgi:Ran GTPase-activating protein (RanGAP) involved in mRNA processing and transport
MKLNDFLNLNHQELNNLQVLDLSGNNFGTLNIPYFQALKHALSQCLVLHTINLSYNYFNWKYFGNSLNIPNFQAFCDFLSQCCCLQNLNLNLNDLGTLKIEHLQSLSNILSRYPNLHILNLSNNELGFLEPDCFQVLCDILSKSNNLQKLYLEGNYFDQTQNQQLNTIIEIHNKQVYTDRKTTKTILFHWHRLQSSNQQLTMPTTTLGNFPKEIIIEILRYIGYIYGDLTIYGTTKFVRKPLNLYI